MPVRPAPVRGGSNQLVEERRNERDAWALVAALGQHARPHALEYLEALRHGGRENEAARWAAICDTIDRLWVNGAAHRTEAVRGA